jgi:hypothetical protein
MQALQETTDWATPNHVYLLDGNNLVAYIRNGTTEPVYFKNPIKGFSKSGRKFKPVEPNPFKSAPEVAVNPNLVRVQGSKPNTWYEVDTLQGSCTCPGYTFRGSCKHVRA